LDSKDSDSFEKDIFGDNNETQVDDDDGDDGELNGVLDVRVN